MTVDKIPVNMASVDVSVVWLIWWPVVHLSVIKDNFELCVYGGNSGKRSGHFCFVFLLKQDYESPFRWVDAINFCRQVGILADDFTLMELNLLPVKQVNMEGFTRIQDQERRCHRNVTNYDECFVVCKIVTCPLGTFDPPKCLSTCQCKQMEYCDVLTGACRNEKCPAGFYDPPLCWQSCNCLYDATCDAMDGFCPFGCTQGWAGRDCKTRQCPLGYAGPPKCDHKCHCENVKDCDIMSGLCEHGCAEGWNGRNCSSPCQVGEENCGSCFCSDPHCKDPPGLCKCEPGWGGKLCSERKCPFGTFGPPNCDETCHCENDRFCSPSDGNCHGTPCEDRWLGTNCQDRGCDPGYFGPPLCLFICHCANGTCDHKEGKCEHGCKQGWRGSHCSIRLCPEGTFGIPKCDRACGCLSNLSCNAVTGQCEGESCQGELTGPYCNISARKIRLASRHQMYSTSSDIAIVFIAVLVLVVGWGGYTVCFPPLRRKRSEMKDPDAPDVSRQEMVSAVPSEDAFPVSDVEMPPESTQES